MSMVVDTFSNFSVTFDFIKHKIRLVYSRKYKICETIEGKLYIFIK